MNLIELHRQELERRVTDGEIKETSKQTYQTDASKVLEAVVGVLPVEVIVGCIDAWGARGSNYTPVINQLRRLALQKKGQPEGRLPIRAAVLD
ncbi:MAG: hypothetical protein U9R72_00315 [Chloroflexota bacterium]|nr:hypothetical protein [Chloroflexota bacterium]